MFRSLFIVCFLILGANFQVAAQSDPIWCSERGFLSDQLQCTKCEELKEFVKKQELYDDCKKCCYEVNKVEKKYVSAELKMCSCQFERYPHIKNFIEQENEQRRYPTLTINYARLEDPIIQLRTEDGMIDELPISKWKTENLEEFFNTVLLTN